MLLKDSVNKRNNPTFCEKISNLASHKKVTHQASHKKVTQQGLQSVRNSLLKSMTYRGDAYLKIYKVLPKDISNR